MDYFDDNKLESVAVVANKLIDKLSEAVGFVFAPRGRYMHRMEGEKLFLKEIAENKELDVFTKAAIMSNTRKIIKQYKNQNDIVQIAVSNLQKSASPENVDESWIMEFMDKCKNIQDDTIKIIWGKILAEECNNNGSVSKKVIHVLAYIDNEEAKIFEKICENIVIKKSTNQRFPYIDYNIFNENYWSKYGFTISQFRRLMEAGLIIYNEKLYTEIKGGKEILIVNGEEIEVHSAWDELLYAGSVLFTTAGEIIASIIEIKEKDKEFVEALKCALGYRNTMDMI